MIPQTPQMELTQLRNQCDRHTHIHTYTHTDGIVLYIRIIFWYFVREMQLKFQNLESKIKYREMKMKKLADTNTTSASGLGEESSSESSDD